jgi:hypothetical protein
VYLFKSLFEMGHFSFVVVFWVESKRNEMKW